MPTTLPFTKATQIGLSVQDFGPIAGPFNFAGRILVAGSIPSTGQCAVARSSNGGATWTVFAQPLPSITGSFQVDYDIGANIFSFFGSDGAGHIRMAQFNNDQSSLTWLANFDSDGSHGGNDTVVSNCSNVGRVINAGLAGQVGGFSGFVILYTDTAGDLKTINIIFVAFLGNIYAPNNIIPPIQTVDAHIGGEVLQAVGAVVDPATGVVHIAYVSHATNGNLFYNNLTLTGAAPAPFVFAGRSTIASPPPTGGFAKFGNSILFGDRIIFCEGWVTAAGQVNRFYRGTPIAAPVWTTLNVHPVQAVPPTDQEMCVIDASAFDGTIWFLYNRTNGVNPSTLLQTMRVRWDGSNFFTPELAWDALLFPPNGIAGNPQPRQTDGIAATLFASGGNTLQVAVTTTIGSQTAVFLAFAPISIICDNPPAGGIGLPYSHFFPASGGVPPYTYSISAGFLPGGLSLNGATGEVSGTPTASGTFPFTVRAVDSAANSASIACSIVIGCPKNAQGA